MAEHYWGIDLGGTKIEGVVLGATDAILARIAAAIATRDALSTHPGAAEDGLHRADRVPLGEAAKGVFFADAILATRVCAAGTLLGMAAAPLSIRTATGGRALG